MFSALKDELVIGEVYVRVYNEQPTFVLEDAKGFATALLDFIGSNAQVSAVSTYITEHRPTQRLRTVILVNDECHHDDSTSHSQYLHSLMAITSSEVDTSKQGQHAGRLRNVAMALEALYNVIHGNAGVEVQCLGQFKLLFSLLRLQGANRLQTLALQVINHL